MKGAGVVVRVLIPFALGYFLSYAYRVVNAVLAPGLIQDLDLDAAALGFLSSAYFLSFAAFQLPLGILLDRFGPRRTEATLLLVAATGALAFATAEALSTLILARALIGVGVSACLMAAFKAFVQWFPPARLPLINGCQLAAGGLGAVVATTPVEALAAIVDWRGVFLVLAALTLMVALIVAKVVPDKPATTGFSLGDQLAGTGRVFASRSFIRTAPLTVMSQASFLAIQSLWSGPWLTDVAGLGRGEAAHLLLLIAISMIAGFLGMGFIAERLGRLGIRPMTLAVIGMMAFMVSQVVLVMQWTEALTLTWMMFGFFGTTGSLPYAALSQKFPSPLAGRLNTGLNLLTFVGAFAGQWGIGWVIGLWPRSPGGGYAAEGYQVAFAVMFVLQLLGLAWFALYRREGVPQD
jgi:sugar phosphate permease